MEKVYGSLSLRIAVASGVVLICSLWVAGQYWGGENRVISGPEDLRSELLRAQRLTDPGGESPSVLDVGSFMFVPDGDPITEVFAEGLVPVAGTGGCPVTLFEDILTRETVFVNIVGEEIVRLPPLEGYTPSTVVMTALLLAPETAAEGDKEIRYGGATLTGKGFPGVAPASTDLSGMDAVDKEAPGLAGVDGGTAGTGGEKDSRLPASSQTASAQGFAVVNLTLYADADIGSDLHDGFSRFVEASGTGPKASVQHAIDAAVSGDTIELRGVSAFADRMLTAGDRRLVLRPMGHVRF